MQRGVGSLERPYQVKEIILQPNYICSVTCEYNKEL